MIFPLINLNLILAYMILSRIHIVHIVPDYCLLTHDQIFTRFYKPEYTPKRKGLIFVISTTYLENNKSSFLKLQLQFRYSSEKIYGKTTLRGSISMKLQQTICAHLGNFDGLKLIQNTIDLQKIPKIRVGMSDSEIIYQKLLCQIKRNITLFFFSFQNRTT